MPENLLAKPKVRMGRGIRTQIDADGSLVDFVCHLLVLRYSSPGEGAQSSGGGVLVRMGELERIVCR